MATIKSHPNFNVDHACKEIFEALNSSRKYETKKDIYSENELRLIEVLTSHDNDQRQNICMKYKQLNGFCLKDHIKAEITGDLQVGLVSLLYTPAEYDARTLHRSLNLLHKKPLSVIEILTTRNSFELRQIEKVYERKFNRELTDDLQSDECEGLNKLLRFLVKSNRPNDHDSIDTAQATKDAQLLYEAGEAHFSSSESDFLNIICERSFEQLRKTFSLYEKLSGKNISESIKSETSGIYEECLLCVVECVKDMPRFFAEQLNKDLEDYKTDCLIRCLISRAEVDLEIVKQLYEGLYDQSLYNRISSEKFGCYEALLRSIVKA